MSDYDLSIFDDFWKKSDTGWSSTSVDQVQNSVSEEESKVRKLQPPGPVALPLPIREITPPGFSSGVSTIAPCEKKAEVTPLFQPELPPPSESKSYPRIIASLSTMVEGLVGRHISFLSDTLRSDAADLEGLQKQKVEALKKHAEEMTNQHSWSTWNSVAQYLTSATSVALGLAAAATGGTTAAFFLLSGGILGAGYRYTTDTGFFTSAAQYIVKSQETQRKVASWIESSMLYLSIGSGLMGGYITALNPLALMQGVTLASGAKKTATYFSQFSGAFTAYTKWGETSSQKMLGVVQAKLRTLEGSTTMQQQKLADASKEMKKAVEAAKMITKESKDILDSVENS